MSELLIIAALAAVVVGLCAYAAWSARRRALSDQPRDWRVDWCVPECYADHRQTGPCKDCPARRAARR